VDPQFEVHRLVKTFKGRLSRLLRQEFPAAAFAAAVVVDKLVFRGDRRWGAVVGDQAVCRVKQETVSESC
jgi:hypothetical protein